MRLERGLLKLAYAGLKVMGSPLPPLASASCVIVKGEKILSVELGYKKGLSLPGGLLEAGENFETGAIREVKEETGLSVKLIKLVGEYSCFDDFPTINRTYFAQIVDGTLKSSSEGRVLWLAPKMVWQKAAYEDVRLALEDYFGLDNLKS